MFFFVIKVTVLNRNKDKIIAHDPFCYNEDCIIWKRLFRALNYNPVYYGHTWPVALNAFGTNSSSLRIRKMKKQLSFSECLMLPLTQSPLQIHCEDARQKTCLETRLLGELAVDTRSSEPLTHVLCQVAVWPPLIAAFLLKKTLTLPTLFKAFLRVVILCLAPTEHDECASGQSLCDENAICTNTIRGHLCTCKPGYVGNGTICKGEFPPRNSPPDTQMQTQTFLHIRSELIPCPVMTWFNPPSSH